MGFKEALRAAGVPFEEVNGAIQVVIPKSKVQAYLAIAETPPGGFWNEIVGTQWLFLFGRHVGVGLPSQRRVFWRCKAWSQMCGQCALMEMLWAATAMRFSMLIRHDDPF